MLKTTLANILNITIMLLGLASSASIPCKIPSATQLHAQWTDYIMGESMNAPESFFAVQVYKYVLFDCIHVKYMSLLFHLMTEAILG